MSLVPISSLFSADPFFNDFFGLTTRPAAGQNTSLVAHLSPFTASAPRCDLIEKADHFEIKADVPGFTKDQINVEVHDGVLTISADKSEEKTDDSEKDGVKWHRVERSSGSLRRQVKLPATANLEAITAASADGVLTLTVAKKPEAAGAAGPRKVPIA